MSITELCIRRPVFATVINIMLLVFGFIAFEKLTVREYPKIDEPVVTVETKYPGASPEIIESQITKPLEDSLAGIEGIEVLSSISRSEQSQISVRFKITRNPDEAANDVRDRVGRVRSLLPEEVLEPVISKVEADAQPIIWLAFYSDKFTPMEISDYADRYVKDRLQNIEGVSNVMIFGERKISMRIWLDAQKLAAYKMTPQDIEAALRSQNVEIPAGRIESTDREFTVLSETDLQTVDQFNNLILRQDENSLVRLSDVGKAEIVPLDERRTTRFNGKEAVALGVVKQSTANPLEVSAGIKKILPKIEKDLPKALNLMVAYDSSVFIQKSIDSVFKTIVEATILVVLVIFFFLRSGRSMMIPLVTIPLSLMGTFAMMYFMGFSINTLTLLSMVLAIGLVVDDAIVMLENIYRHIEEGMKPFEAAIKGSKEIAFAVVAMTITLAAVYAPIGFIEGRTGKLFTEFALTLAGAVIISGFIALTLSPMMCAKLLKHEKSENRLFTAIENFLNGMQNKYNSLLGGALRARFIVVIAGVGLAVSSVVFLKMLKSELSPVEDRGTIISIGIAPEGSTIDYTTEWMQKLEPLFSSIPEVEKYFVVAGMPSVSQGISFTRLKPWEERTRKQQDIVAELQPKMFMGITGIMAFPTNPPSLGRSPISKPIEFIIQTNGSYEKLNQIVNSIMNEARSNPGLTGIDSDLKLNKPQISLTINRDKAALAGVGIDQIGRTLETLMGGRQVTRFKRDGEQYDVVVKIKDELRTRPQDITEVYVRNNKGEMIKLSNLVEIKETIAPRELNHFNQLRAAKITANVTAGYTVGQALEYLQQKADAAIDDDMLTDLDGESREFMQSSASLVVTFALALVFIYLVLSAQFESFLSPFIIMLTVPLSIAGALIVLYSAGGTLNIYSQIGLITLIGLITKNGILIVDFANKLMLDGKDAFEAAQQAAALRLRPILMTSLSMILGSLPLALSTGAGAESREQIGYVILGGLSIGTLFTLFVIPVVYTFFKGGKAKQPEN